MSKEIKVPDTIIYVCNGKTCKKKGGKELRKQFKEMRKYCGANVQVIKTGCTDNCKNAPIVAIQPDNVWFAKTDSSKAMEICERIKKGSSTIDDSAPHD